MSKDSLSCPPSLLPTKDSLLGVLVLLVLSVAIIFPLALSFLPHLVGVVGCIIVFFQKRKLYRPDWKIIGVLAGISALTLTSSVWATYPEKSFYRAIKVSMELLLFIPFLILLKTIHENSLAIIKKYFFIPFFISGLFICSELIFHFPVITFLTQRKFEAWELSKQITSFILLSPFAIIFLLEAGYKKRVMGLIAIALGMLSFSDNQAAQLAALISVVTYAGYVWLPSLMLRICFSVGFLGLSLTPWISSFIYDLVANKVGDEGILRKASTSQRLEIWDFISRKIMENPWVGYGIDSTRYITFDGRMVYYKDQMIIHPHNFSLQIWIEFGAIGLICASIILAYFYISMRCESYKSQILPVIIFSSSFIILFVSWSMWSSWFIGLLLLLLSFYQMTSRSISYMRPNSLDK